MYSVPQNQQLLIFLASIGLGFALGILYDVLRTIRLTIWRSKASIIIFDILYFIIVGFVSFLFILAMNKGEVRLYIPLGEVIGWLFYYLSFGLVAIRITDVLVKFIRWLFSLIFKIPFYSFFILYHFNKLFVNRCLISITENNFIRPMITKHFPQIFFNIFILRQ
jgi:spore cortex biosynthesis protein YabQ